jgi:hypothetical protein
MELSLTQPFGEVFQLGFRTKDMSVAESYPEPHGPTGSAREKAVGLICSAVLPWTLIWVACRLVF